MRILSRSDVEHALSMREAIEIIKGAFAQLAAGQAVVPLRVPVPVAKHDGVTLFMPAYLEQSDALAVKIVSVFNQNPAKNLPLIHALVVVVDAETGIPIAAMEGGYLTALRTGAVSGAATDLMARRDVQVAAIFGAGVQARTQLLGIGAVRQFERAWVYDVVPGAAEKYVREMAGRPGVPPDLRAASSPAEAVRDADVICTATTAITPVYDGNDLKPGAHVNGVGSYTPQMQENDLNVVRRASKIVVDAQSGAWAEAGDLIIAVQKGVIKETDVYAEFGEICGGQKPGRKCDDEITFFKSVGNAVQDASVARAILGNARKRNLGVEVNL